MEKTLEDYTKRISKALNVVGLVNIQYAYDGKKIYVIEVNPRASRTVPILSKVTRVPMVKLAVAAMLGHKLRDSEYGTGLYKKTEEYAVKVPVFSSAKLTDMDIALGPEMKSTGEVLGIDKDLDKAIYKGFLGAGMSIPTNGNVFVTLKESEQNTYTADILRDYAEAGFRLYATDDTIEFIMAHDIPVEPMDYVTAQKWIMNHDSESDEKISLVINIPVVANRKERESFPVRRKAIERGISVMTCMDTARVFLKAVKLKQQEAVLDYEPLE